MPSRAASRSAPDEGPQWFDAGPAPVVLLSGPEELLRDRALERIVAAVRAASGTADVHRLEAAAYSPGALRAAASPSLFAEPAVVVIEGAETMNDDFLADALEYVQHPDPDVVVVIAHAGSTRGKRLLDAMRAEACQRTPARRSSGMRRSRTLPQASSDARKGPHRPRR